MTIITIIALLIATLIPLLVFYLIYARDVIGTGSIRYMALCFLWGVIAFGLAYAIHTLIFNNELLSYDFVVQFLAPFDEEILKGLILLYLIRKRDFTYFVDGAIYGFAVGIGFAIVENYSYLLADPSNQLGLAVGRVISTNLIHATGSAIIGIAVGKTRFSKGSGRIPQIALGVFAAIALHTIFNNVAFRVGGSMQLVTATALGLIGVGIIAFFIQRGLKEGKEWIKEKLGAADRVTAGEAAVVQRIEDLDKLLEPLAEIFGMEKAEVIYNFLRVQAQLGINRKAMEQLEDVKLKEETRLKIEELRQEMDEARRAVGPYAMIYLRGIFPEEGPLWGNLDKVIEDHIAANQTPEGGGLWGKLEEAAKPRSVIDDEE